MEKLVVSWGWLLVCVCAVESQARVTVRSEAKQVDPSPLSQPESDDNGETDGGQSFLQWLSNFWYVLLVVLVVLVVVCVFICACIVRKRRSSHHTFHMELRSQKFSQSPESNRSRQQSSSIDEHLSVPQHTYSSVIDGSMSPGSYSIDPTPVPSPQPSFASQRSLRSSGRGSGRKKRRNHSPGHSSGSEETIRPGDARSSMLSLASSVSSMGYPPRLDRAHSLSSAEKVVFPPHHKGHRRTTSNPLVKVSISGVGDDGNMSLHSAPSTSSMLSVGSNHSARSGHSHTDASSQQTVVEVDVKVHLGPDQEQEARRVTAAALAESARQLAQSAADFDNELFTQSLPHRSYPHPHPYLGPRASTCSTTRSLPMNSYPNRKHLFPSHSSSYLPSRDYSRPCSPRAVQTISLDRPVNSVSLDRPVHTYPFQRDRSRHDYAPPQPQGLFLVNREPQRRSPTTVEMQYPGRAPLGQYTYSLEPRIPRLDSEALRHSPVSQAGGEYARRPPGRPFHTLDSYPMRSNERSEFLSLKAQRSNTVNGMYPMYPMINPPQTISLDRNYGMEQNHRMEQRPRVVHEPNHRMEQRLRKVQEPTPRMEQRLRTAKEPIPRMEQQLRTAQEPIPRMEQRLRTAQEPIPRMEQRLRTVQEPTFRMEQQQIMVQEPTPRIEQQLKTVQEPNPRMEQSSSSVMEPGLASHEEVTEKNVKRRGSKVKELKLAEVAVDLGGSEEEQGDYREDGGTLKKSEVQRERSYPRGVDSRYLTLPHHYIDNSRPPANSIPPPSPTSSSDVPSHVQHHPSPSKLKRVKQRPGRLTGASSDPDLRETSRKKRKKEEPPLDLAEQQASFPSNSSTIPHSPSSSTCLSSHTSYSLQSINEVEGSQKERLPGNATLERQNSLPDVSHLRQDSSSSASVQHRHSKTLSLPRSSSGLSIGGQLSSTASGYAPTGSGSSLDTKSFDTPQLPNHKLETQYSYPLQRLLAQYNPETDEVDLLDPPLDSPHAHHRGFHTPGDVYLHHPASNFHHKYHHSDNHSVFTKQQFSSSRSARPSELYSDPMHEHTNITVEV